MISEPHIEPGPQGVKSTSPNAETLRRFSETLARDTLMKLMADTPTYRASVGTGPGGNPTARHGGGNLKGCAF